MRIPRTSSTAATQSSAKRSANYAEAVDDDDTTAVCNEAADVLFVAIGHIEALGTQGLDGVRYVTTKNAHKTAQTPTQFGRTPASCCPKKVNHTSGNDPIIPEEI